LYLSACLAGCLLQVRSEQEEAERVAAVVGAEEAEVAAKAAECQALKDDAAAELVRVADSAIHCSCILFCMHLLLKLDIMQCMD
jgi:hypothetical protein